jgi:hypothetical protein
MSLYGTSYLRGLKPRPEGSPRGGITRSAVETERPTSNTDPRPNYRPTKAAPPAQTPVTCAWGVGMALCCPSGAPNGARAYIYQANPIARQSIKPNRRLFKIIILIKTALFCFLWVRRARTVFPEVSQTANESASSRCGGALFLIYISLLSASNTAS